MSCKCKKDHHEKCLCVRRKHGDCIDCEKRAIKTVQESEKDLNETIKAVKESGETIRDLYIEVDQREPGNIDIMFRSAIDILRGVCNYCERQSSKACDECMWSGKNGDKDHWYFNDRY